LSHARAGRTEPLGRAWRYRLAGAVISAGSAVGKVRCEGDALTATLGLAGGTRALAVRALLAPGTGSAARAAVAGVCLQVCASVTAVGQSRASVGGARQHARAAHAARGRCRARMPAGPAVAGIVVEVGADAVATRKRRTAAAVDCRRRFPACIDHGAVADVCLVYVACAALGRAGRRVQTAIVAERRVAAGSVCSLRCVLHRRRISSGLPAP
jgi:hypothetical protein